VRRAIGTLVAAALVTGLIGSTAWASPARGATKPNDRFCAAFADATAVHIAISLASGFPLPGGDSVDRDEFKAVVYVSLSPMLEKLTGEMVKSAPKALRKDLKRQLTIYRKGVELLKGAGVSDRAIQAIADADLTPGSNPTTLAEEHNVSKQQLEAAGKEFRPTIESPRSGPAPSPQARSATKNAVTQCGIAPETKVACNELLADADVAAILGGSAALDDDNGCSWTAGTGSGSDENRLAIYVYATGLAYDRFVKLHDGGEPVAGLGDRSVAADGFSSQSVGSSCGRTIATRARDRTVQVALCLRDRDVTTDEVAAVVKQVLPKL
jgi:hypothetical protein